MKIKKTVAAFLALVMVLGSTAAIFAKDWSGQQSFSDVKKSHWAHGYVENLANQGIVSGYGKTDSFKPENPILRQEAAKMIAEAAGLKASAGFVSKFVDLGDAGEWALKYIYALEESGVINGFGATREFRPKDFIQRGHIALMLVRAFNLKSGPLDVLISDLNLTGNDREARAAIEILASNGIVSGFGNTNKFHPLNDIDRAGFAKMVALAQAAAAVQKAEASGNPADIAGAKALIGNLPDNQDKETQKSLLDRLDETVPVKSVVVSPTTLALTVDQTGTVTATVAPGDATNKTVAWTTSNAAVATVAGGVVTAVSAGTATITATAGEKTATVAVTVKNIQQAAPAGLAAVPPTTAGGNDGKITGVTDAMEYKLSTAAAYTAVTGTEITGLAAGTYHVRFAAKAKYDASPVAEVIVPKFTYEVIFYDEDGLTVLETLNVEENVMPAPTVVPTKAASAEYTYTFAGWTPALAAATVNTSYKATYTSAPVNYTLTWVIVDGPSHSYTYAFGSPITVLANPGTIPGYSFSWDQEIPATMPASDLTITGKWTANKYTITFDSDDGSEVDSITQDYGTAITAPANPTKEGHTFDGWDKTIPTTMPAEDLTIKAKWIINDYTITYKITEEDDVVETYKYGASIGLQNKPTKEGYTFYGWYPETLPATMPADNLVVTGSFGINQYTITYDRADGTVANSVTLAFGASITSPADPTREGYTFYGWSPELPKTMPATNQTHTALWTPVEYTITFDSAGGSKVADITQAYDTAIIVPDDPTKDGYTFEGWAPALPTKMPLNGASLTAQWTKIPDAYSNALLAVEAAIEAATNAVKTAETSWLNVDFTAARALVDGLIVFDNFEFLKDPPVTLDDAQQGVLKGILRSANALLDTRLNTLEASIEDIVGRVNRAGDQLVLDGALSDEHFKYYNKSNIAAYEAELDKYLTGSVLPRTFKTVDEIQDIITIVNVREAIDAEDLFGILETAGFENLNPSLKENYFNRFKQNLKYSETIKKIQWHIIDVNDKFEDKTIKAVEDAETAKTQSSVDAAHTLVGKLPEGDIKTSLQDRLDVVQAAITAGTDFIAVVQGLPSVQEISDMDPATLAETKTQVEAARAMYVELSSLAKTVPGVWSWQEKLRLKEEAIVTREERQLIFDINRINGEGNMAKKLALVGLDSYDILENINKVEIAYLFIHDRGITDPETPTENVIREGYNSIDKIKTKLTDSISLYNMLIINVHNATTVPWTKTHLNKIANYFSFMVNDEMAEIIFNTKFELKDADGNIVGYQSVSEMIAALTDAKGDAIAAAELAIAAIPDEITLEADTVALVKAAREKFEAAVKLSATAEDIGGYEKLSAAETKIDELNDAIGEFNGIMGKIKSAQIKAYTVSSTNVLAARALYDNFIESQKALISSENYDKLLRAERALAGIVETDAELAAALTGSVNTIVLDGTFGGFSVARPLTLVGGTINGQVSVNANNVTLQDLKVTNEKNPVSVATGKTGTSIIGGTFLSGRIDLNAQGEGAIKFWGQNGDIVVQDAILEGALHILWANGSVTGVKDNDIISAVQTGILVVFDDATVDTSAEAIAIAGISAEELANQQARVSVMSNKAFDVGYQQSNWANIDGEIFSW